MPAQEPATRLTSERDRVIVEKAAAVEKYGELLKVVDDSTSERVKLLGTVSNLETARNQLSIQFDKLSRDRAGLAVQVDGLRLERDLLAERNNRFSQASEVHPARKFGQEIAAVINVILIVYALSHIVKHCRPETPATDLDNFSNFVPTEISTSTSNTLHTEDIQLPSSPRTLDRSIRRFNTRLELVENVVSDTVMRGAMLKLVLAAFAYAAYRSGAFDDLASQAVAESTRWIAAKMTLYNMTLPNMTLPVYHGLKRPAQATTFEIEADGTVLQIPITICEENKKQLSTRFSELVDHRNDLVKHIGQLEQKLEASAVQQEQMRREYQSLWTITTRIQTERDKLDVRVGKLTQDVDKSAATIKKLISERDRSMRAEKTALTENNKLLKSIANSNAQHEKLSNATAELETARRQLTVQLAGVLADRASLSQQVKSLANERDQLYERQTSLLQRRLYCPSKSTPVEVAFWVFTVASLCCTCLAAISIYRLGGFPWVDYAWRFVRAAGRRGRGEAKKPCVCDLKPSVPAPDETAPAELVPALKPELEPEPPASPHTLDSQVRRCSSRLDLVGGPVSDMARRVDEHNNLLREQADKATFDSGSDGADKHADSDGADLSSEDSRRDDADSDSSIEVLFALDE
ncbi:hypothetical protein B0A53_00051 [Rhodotorula sp. CCFEE 5036]|nr:hypothetical protein B0A53_00051 [Rhodotorula sp. CCFEE 5036]